MSGLVRALFMLFAGLVLGVSYNAWPISGTDPYGAMGTGNLQQLDIVSYMAGLLLGMTLWQVSNVPWAALPAKLQAYLASQMHLYQFVVMGAACLAVLIYF